MQIRFVIRLDGDWRGTVACQQDDAWRRPIALARVEDPAVGRFPGLDVPLHDPDARHEQLDGGPATPAQIQAVYDRVLGRVAEPAEIDRFGHYLFDALLGAALWSEMEQLAEQRGAVALELALSFPDDDYDLHRLNWELMRSDARFLAAPGPKLDVAITRLVDTDLVAPAQLDVPPRVLFVVGTALTEQKIRPGAELHALLRQARGGRAMRYRLLERASPRLIQQAVKEFHPEIVHVICHGGVDEDSPRVYLNLQTDEVDTRPQRYAPELAFDLTDGDWRPKIVVLSACLTGGSQGAPRFIAGAHEAAPFAAALVKSGIPIVLGMAGRIADITSRQFARAFGEAVIRGMPLVLAMAKARQVAFTAGLDASKTADWAFPAVFMARDVPAAYRPVDATSSDRQWKQIEDWIEGYNLNQTPVFCAREDVLARFPQLFENPGGRRGDERDRRERVLAVLVDRLEAGYGRTRLLQELAAQAFRDGHIPVLLTFEPTEAPRNLRQLLEAFDRAISTLRVDVLGIGEADSSQLYLVGNRDPAASGLDPTVKAELRRSHGELTDKAVRHAIRADLATLLTDARRRIQFLERSAGQVVVLLDDIDRYGELVARLLAREGGLLGPMGFGVTGDPVPVVMTASRGGDPDATLKEIDEKPKSVGWLAVERLRPFQANGEDLLACQAVLLHPFEPAIMDDVSGVPWAFNDAVAPEVRERWEGLFRVGLKGGLPCLFQTDRLYLVAAGAAAADFVVRADDEIAFAKLPRRL